MARSAAIFACGLCTLAIAPALAIALASAHPQLEGLPRISITDPLIWWSAAASLLSRSQLAPPAYVPLLGLLPHVVYLVGLVMLASAVVGLAGVTGRDLRPFTVGVLAATASVLTAAPSWFWGITGLFFAVPPAIVEVLAVGYVCSRVDGRFR